MNPDLFYALLIFGLVLLAALAYGFRVLFRGRAQFNRVDKQGGSALLSKEMMEGFYWFLQPLGKFLVYCRVTPNQISWTSLLLGVISGACLAFGHFGSGAAFAIVSAIMDTLDGMVARSTGISSDAGEVLDASVDRYTEFLFLGGLALYYREIPLLLALTLVALVGSFMVSYSTAKAEALQVEPPKGNMRRPERAAYLIAGAALSPVTIPIWESAPDFPVPVAHPMIVALGLVAVMANFSAIERLWAVAKIVRRREADAAAAKAQQAQLLSSRVTPIAGDGDGDVDAAAAKARV